MHLVKHVIRKQDVVQMGWWTYVIAANRLDTMVFVQAQITVHVIKVVHHTNRADIRIPPMPARHITPTVAHILQHVQQHVHRSQTPKHVAGQNRVQLQTVLAHGHIPINVSAIIPVVVVNRRVRHVRDVIHGHAPVQVHAP